jgi:hypothetical protein
MGGRGPCTGLAKEAVLALLADTDYGAAVRALRRHRAWRDAAAAGGSWKAQRSLRRAWERGRDQALAVLDASAPPLDVDAGT